MDNGKSLAFFSKLSKNANELVVKIKPENDHTDIDAAFLVNNLHGRKRLLDLGSGSGLLINKVYNYFDHITAVEAFSEFAKYIVNSTNVEIVISDIKKFKTKKKFDAVTMFGLVQYFSTQEIAKIYRLAYGVLDVGGTLIVKNQFGVDHNKVVSGYSDELGDTYYSEYRTVNCEKELMINAGFNNIERFDIYPKKFNKWIDTHYYALIARKS